MTAMEIVSNPVGAAILAVPAVEAGIGSMWDAARHDARRAIEVGAQGVATATAPAAGAVSDVAAAVKGVADDLKDVAKKALIGEVIAAGVVLLGVGAAIWFTRGSGKKAGKA